MTQQEKDALLHGLSEQQIALMATMSASDAHASKCTKLGLDFQQTYPEDYDAYTSARSQYNENEIRIEEIKNTPVDDEPRPDEIEA